VRKCLMRGEQQCSFLEFMGYKVIYRRYASLFFIVGAAPTRPARRPRHEPPPAAVPPPGFFHAPGPQHPVPPAPPDAPGCAAGVDDDENEIAVLEFIHCLVETLDK